MTELVLDGELPKEQRDALGIVHNSASSLLSLLNDVLDFSKIEADKLELSPVVFDLRELLEDALRTVAHRAAIGGLELVCRVAPEVPDILRGDASRLCQIVSNLVGNAVKFTERGHILVEARLEAAFDERVSVSISVTDTGVGLNADETDAIFEPFTQADASVTRRYGGTGLGLAICRRLAILFGGGLDVESTKGQGSCFSFTAWLELVLESDEAHADAGGPALVGRRVVVAAPPGLSRDALVEVLEWWGLELEFADSGEALATHMDIADTTDRLPDLILLACPLVDGEHEPGTRRALELARSRGLPWVGLATVDKLHEAVGGASLTPASRLMLPIKQRELRSALAQILFGAADGGREEGLGSEAIPDGRGRRVLIAEDNAVNQLIARRIVERGGYEADVVCTGQAALEAVASTKYDIVLMDVQMPEMDGVEATQRIRERERISGDYLPIVMLTAHAMTGDRQRFLEAGADAYVSKPIDRGALLAAMERLTRVGALTR